MEHAALMREEDRAGHFHQQAHTLVRPGAKCFHMFRQAPAGKVFHAETRAAVHHPDVENRRDVRVIESCGHFHFRAEPPLRRLACQSRGMDDFDGDNSVETGLVRLVNDAHAPAADLGEQFVFGIEIRFGAIVGTQA